MTASERVLPTWADPGDLAAAAVRIAEVVARPGRKRIAMPGGSTAPKLLASLVRPGVDWRGTTVVPTDERQVAADHPASNLRLLREALAATGAEIVPLHDGDPVDGFDLVWLGMGEDGHVASLFPCMAAGQRQGPRVIATVPEPLPREAPFARLSLNLEALSAADEIMLVVTGQPKRAVIEAAIAGERDDLPIAGLLRAARCPLTIYWSP